jgi:hypothetical protein
LEEENKDTPKLQSLIPLVFIDQRDFFCIYYVYLYKTAYILGKI